MSFNARTGRIAAVAAGVVAALVAMTGCGSGASGGGGENGAVAMGFASGDVSIWNATLDRMRPIIEEAGYEFLTSDPQWDVQRQVSDWDAWVQRGDVKAIMGYPVQADAIVPVTQRAIDAGIPVVGYAVDWEGVDRIMKLDDYNDGYALGAAAAEWINEKFPGGEEVPVAVVADRTSDLSIGRANGISDGLKESAPNVTISEVPALSREEGYSVAKTYLTANPDTKVWLAGSSDQASGVYQALLDEGVPASSADHLLASLDATNETLDILKAGDTLWSIQFALSVDDLAEANAGLLLAAANGEPAEDVVLASSRVTPENLDGFYVR